MYWNFSIRKHIALLIVFVIGVLPAVMVSAQDDDTPPPGRPDLSEVFVTTQDNTVLRAGPGLLFDRLGVVPFDSTLPAVGRTADGEWLQIAYEGEIDPDAPEDNTVDGITYGWMFSDLLVWSGDILTLPVDGVPYVPFARRTLPLVTIDSNTYYYRDGVDPSTRVLDTVDEPTVVELTGRVGTFTEEGFFWLQFELNGEYYWTASWEIGTPPEYFRLPDGAYVYPYGRLLLQLRQEINRNNGVLSTISRRWNDLDAGFQVTCNDIPDNAFIREDNFRQQDLEVEPLYAASIRAVREAIVFINAALERFREVCSRPAESRFITPEEVALALSDIAEAQRLMHVASTFIEPFEQRDPLLGNDG